MLLSNFCTNSPSLGGGGQWTILPSSSGRWKKYRQSTPVKVHLKFEFQVRHSLFVIELVFNRTSVPVYIYIKTTGPLVRPILVRSVAKSSFNLKLKPLFDKPAVLVWLKIKYCQTTPVRVQSWFGVQLKKFKIVRFSVKSHSKTLNLW